MTRELKTSEVLVVDKVFIQFYAKCGIDRTNRNNSVASKRYKVQGLPLTLNFLAAVGGGVHIPY